jgi:stalled ribosome rescue protein Dom34
MKGIFMKTELFHAVIWIDHHEARIFHFNSADVELQTLQPKNPDMHIHHKTNTIGSGHEKLEESFLHETATAVSNAVEILIVGPGNAKTELMSHITHHDAKLKRKILGIETVDHPTDGQIVAYARKFFKSALRMTPQI